MKCSFCHGPLVPLGTLGNLDWFQCRDCGMETSTPADHGSYDYVEHPCDEFTEW